MAAAPDQDVMAMLNKKIREFEAKDADEQAKAQKLQKGRAKKKIKEAKKLMEKADLSEAEKVLQLWKSLQDEQEATMKLSAKAEVERKEIKSVEQDREGTKQELDRTIVMKEKLESLCRQLQQQTKALADESRQLTENERRRRQELADEFQNTIGDVKKKMDQQAQERAEQARENEELRSRFKQFFERYDVREKELLKQQKDHEQEVKTFEAKLTEQVQLYRQEASREATAQRENDALMETEKVLKAQLQTYTDKYGQFQGALSKSDKVFGQYKRQRNKIQRQVDNLEKENAELRVRNEKKLTMTIRDRDNLLRTKEQLQERCTTLQQERQQARANLESLQLGEAEAGGG